MIRETNIHACGILMLIACDLHLKVCSVLSSIFWDYCHTQRLHITVPFSCCSGSLPTPCRFGCAWNQGCSWNLLLQVWKPPCGPTVQKTPML